jgi:hypothetical protein
MQFSQINAKLRLILEKPMLAFIATIYQFNLMG